MFEKVNLKIENQPAGRWLCLLTLFSLLLVLSCKKDKADFQRDSAVERVTGELSHTRIIDLYGYDQVIANGDSLTNFVAPLSPTDPLYKKNHYKFPGTKYFPEDGRFGNSWWSGENFDAKVGYIWKVPKSLFRSDNSLDVELQILGTNRLPYEKTNFSIALEKNRNMDYYIVPEPVLGGRGKYFAAERDETVSKPGYFKIRVINLTYFLGSRSNFNGPFEDHYGDITLTYANGEPVSAATSNVDPAKKVSEYVEVPYGTYQFKVLSQLGREISGATGNNVYRILDPPSSSLPRSLFDPSNVVYAPIKTYQPGGVYTIVVTPLPCEFIMNELGYTDIKYQNLFKIIEDKESPVNMSYTRVQGVNALPGQAVSFRLNGVSIENNIKYSEYSKYQIKENGKYQVEAVDAGGKVLAQMEQNLDARMNYTFWLYPGADGTSRMSVSSNDLSGDLHMGSSEDDGSFGYQHYTMPFSKRFFNFCPDFPYLTITTNNGQVIGGAKDNPAVYNLKPGELPAYFPYTWGDWKIKSYEILAYRSTPQVTPGIWADDIKVLTNDNFIARKELYTSTSKKLPAHEPGVYSVALIGRTGSQVPAEFKAKMIFIKHNQ